MYTTKKQSHLITIQFLTNLRFFHLVVKIILQKIAKNGL